jgi:hypothetical protein
MASAVNVAPAVFLSMGFPFRRGRARRTRGPVSEKMGTMRSRASPPSARRHQAQASGVPDSSRFRKG